MSLFISKKTTSNPTGFLLKDHIKEKKWREVRKIIASKFKLEVISETQGRCSPLLYACKYDPPLNIVTSLLKGNPSSASETDNNKNLPLHIACQYGASPEVIKALLEANKDAITQKDTNGMLPIHKVCRHYFRNARKSQTDEEIMKALKAIFKVLLGVNPTSILEEDNKEKCPIEHALEGGMRVELVTALRAKAESERMKRKESCTRKVPTSQQ